MTAPKRRGRGPLIIALVAVLVVAGVGIGLAVSGVFGSSHTAVEDPGAQQAGIAGPTKKLWSAPAVGSPSRAYGGWIIDDHSVAYVAENLIIGYDLTTGKQLWRLPPPAGTRICDLSRTADGGIGAVSYSHDAHHCATVAAIDVKTGKQLWQADFPLLGGDYPVQNLSVADSTVVIDTHQTVFGYGATDGQPHWAAPPVWDDGMGGTFGSLGGQCTSGDAWASGDQTAQVLICPLDVVEVVAYDTATGAVKWQKRTPLGRPPGRWWLLSANPVVAADDFGIHYLPGPNADSVVIDETASSSGSYAYGEALFSAGMMITVDDSPVEPHDKTLMLAAHDLATGKLRWTHQFDTGAKVALIDVNGQGVRVAYTAPDTSEDQLMSFSLDNGAMTRGATIGSAPYNAKYQPFTTKLIGPEVVRFSSPMNPVTVWGLATGH